MFRNDIEEKLRVIKARFEQLGVDAKYFEKIRKLDEDEVVTLLPFLAHDDIWRLIAQGQLKLRQLLDLTFAYQRETFLSKKIQTMLLDGSMTVDEAVNLIPSQRRELLQSATSPVKAPVATSVAQPISQAVPAVEVESESESESVQELDVAPEQEPVLEVPPELEVVPIPEAQIESAVVVEPVTASVVTEVNNVLSLLQANALLEWRHLNGEQLASLDILLDPASEIFQLMSEVLCHPTLDELLELSAANNLQKLIHHYTLENLRCTLDKRTVESPTFMETIQFENDTAQKLNDILGNNVIRALADSGRILFSELPELTDEQMLTLADERIFALLVPDLARSNANRNPVMSVDQALLLTRAEREKILQSHFYRPLVERLITTEEALSIDARTTAASIAGYIAEKATLSQTLVRLFPRLSASGKDILSVLGSEFLLKHFGIYNLRREFNLTAVLALSDRQRLELLDVNPSSLLNLCFKYNVMSLQEILGLTADQKEFVLNEINKSNHQQIILNGAFRRAYEAYMLANAPVVEPIIDLVDEVAIARDADSVVVTDVDPVVVTDVDPVVVTDVDPVVVTDADPVVVTDADPVVVTDADPVVVTDADPVVVTDVAPELPPLPDLPVASDAAPELPPLPAQVIEPDPVLNNVDPKITELIGRLATYIGRIQSYTKVDGSIDYTVNLRWSFMTSSQAANRRANHELANSIMRFLDDRGARLDLDTTEFIATAFDDKDMDRCRKRYVSFPWSHGIQSVELKAIIKDAHEFVAENKQNTHRIR